MLVITSPERYQEWGGLQYRNRTPLIFLAGGITGCPDWQSDVIKLLDSYDGVILNPRRAEFDINDDAVAIEQIEWEFEHLDYCRIVDWQHGGPRVVMFWFPKESVCPIALFELGKFVEIAFNDEAIIEVGCHPEYPRKFDVETQLSLVFGKHFKVYDNLEDLTEAARQHLIKC